MESFYSSALAGGAPLVNPFKKVIYIDADNGHDSRSGLSPEKAKITMAEAIAACSNGDTIMLTGRLTENIVTVGTPTNITIMGADNTIRDPLWAHDGETAVLADVNAPGWTFRNIRFDFSDGFSGLKFSWDNDTKMGYQPKVIDCSFQSSAGTKAAIEFWGAPFLAQVLHCRFAEIGGVGGCGIGNFAGGTPIASPNRCTIAYNEFVECTNQIDLHSANNCMFLHNYLQGSGYEKTTIKHLYIDTTGERNVMFGNFFGGDYSIDTNSYKSADGGNDSWVGNIAEDVVACPSGMTLARPSAG